MLDPTRFLFKYVNNFEHFSTHKIDLLDWFKDNNFYNIYLMIKE